MEPFQKHLTKKTMPDQVYVNTVFARGSKLVSFLAQLELAGLKTFRL